MFKCYIRFSFFCDGNMNFIIENEIFERYPELKIGVLVVKGADNTGKIDKLFEEIRSVEEKTRSGLELQSLADHPKIDDWRKAYSSFGAKPKTYKCSVEALLRRVLKKDSLTDINKIVNIYNMISVKHMLPVGGDDLDKVDGNIILKISEGNEPFTLLGGSNMEFPEKGEVIYKDDKDVLCRRWNWRECDKTKMTETTKNVCLVIEALGSTSKEELDSAINELKDKIKEYCGGSSEVFILDKNKSSIGLLQ